MAAGTRVNYLNTDEVHWDGQPVAVVVAETLEGPRTRPAWSRSSYEPLPVEADFAAAAKASASPACRAAR